MKQRDTRVNTALSPGHVPDGAAADLRGADGGSWQLPFDPASASAARTRLATRLSASSAPPRSIDEALIVLSELVANAVRHGKPTADGTFEVSWKVDGDDLIISVRDAGVGQQLAPHSANDEETSGRGLAIIDSIAERWWVDDESGTQVNAALRLA